MKYKLLKDYPPFKSGDIIMENAIGLSPTLNIYDYPDFFEPIVEKKTYDDLKKGYTCFYIDGYGEIKETRFVSDYLRSQIFLTREEAEDEHKRREWAVRKDKFVPKKGEIFYFPSPDGQVYSSEYIDNYETIFINIGLAFRTHKDCQDAIDNHDIIRLFYKIR